MSEASRLSQIVRVHNAKNGAVQCLYECSCGELVVRRMRHVLSGAIKSCGCYRREDSARKGRACFKHGSHKNPTYKSWVSMMTRCYNKNHEAYHRYGGRGITVCDRWFDFFNFLDDMGDRPAGRTLDRKNNDLGYSKANCKWSTPKEQANNRSTNV